MKTIRQQLTRKLLLGFAILLGLGGAGIYFVTRAEMLEQFDDTLNAKAVAITTLIKPKHNKIEVDVPDQFMRGFDEHVATDFFQVRDTNGVSLDRSESLKGLDLPSRYGTFKEPEFWNLKLPSGMAVRAVGFAFTPDDDDENDAAASGKIVLVVASDRHELDETLATFALVLTGFGLLLLVSTWLVVPRVLRRELSPLDQLADQAAGITADSLATRFPTEAVPGELAPISRRLNDLLARLEESFERERRFSADLAHELRTPIAELRSFAELALKWPEARTAQTDREVLAIARQMEGLVASLLAMLRSERNLVPVTSEQTALAPLVQNVWQSFAEKAAAKQLNYSCTVPEQAGMATDPVLLRSILTNLVDNAVEYAPRGGTVRIDGNVGADTFTLRVSNAVEHLTAGDVTKLFDRFWRKDPVRSNNEHSGLGLSLSRAFAHALGYDLTAALDADSQIVLTLAGKTGLSAS